MPTTDPAELSGSGTSCLSASQCHNFRRLPITLNPCHVIIQLLSKFYCEPIIPRHYFFKAAY